MEIDPAHAPSETAPERARLWRDRLEAAALIAVGNLVGVVAFHVSREEEALALTLLVTGWVLQSWGLAKLCLFGGVRPGFLGCAVLGVPLALWLFWTQIAVWVVFGRGD